MSTLARATTLRLEPSGSAAPTWWVVCSRELRDLWIGGKALYLILIYMLLLGIYAFLLASNLEVRIISVKEIVAEMVRAAIAVGLFICLIIGADSISGERERATLEGLLLTPTSRRQIVFGKFVAALSPWPVALLIAIPYWVVLSRGEPVFDQAMLWGPLLGTLLAPAIAGLGMLVSVWCSSNKTSMLLSLCLYVGMLLPTEIMAGPAKIQRTAEQAFRAEVNFWVNPMAAVFRFQWKILVIGDSPAMLWFWHTMPTLLGVVVLGLLFGYASPRLRLDPGTGRKFRSFWSRVPRAASSRTAPRAASSAESGSREPDAGQPEEVFPVPAAASFRTSGIARASAGKFERSPSAAPTWWLVFKKELRDLWIGGKALNLSLIYTVGLGFFTWLMARDSILSFIPPKEMTYEMLKAAMAASVFVGTIIGADAISGERERATLEGLLLTPTSRRQIVFGKFLAAISPWPVAFAIAIPYMKILSQGDEVFGQAIFWGAIVGTMLTPAFTALGMFVGFWCGSNKTSLFVSLCLYLLFLLPTTLLAHAQAGAMGQFMQWVNPLASPRVFLAKILVNNRTLAEYWSWLLSPAVLAIGVFVLLFWYAGPGLRLEPGRARALRWFQWGAARAAVVAMIASLVGLLGAAPAMALQGTEPQAAEAKVIRVPLDVSIDMSDTVVRAGTPLLFNTVLKNTGTERSRPLIVAMNIINLNMRGEIVDPEDWSPQRAQYIEEGLAPGQSDTLSWRVNAILDGDFMVYMVAMGAPASADATTHPMASPGIHLVVTPYTKLNPGGVLPYAIGGPLLLGLLMTVVYRRRRRQIDQGG
jgi:ABC-type transport system involved in multi-copper enzyme maturation permease subunit